MKHTTLNHNLWHTALQEKKSLLTTETMGRVQRDAHNERHLGFILSVEVELARKKNI